MGRKELAVKKVGALNLREVAARATLHNVRQQGHVYVELRQVSKRSIFFCTLCHTQCFSEDVLFAHLKGNLHSKRYASAKITLLLPNPWPFNDGVLFFNDSLANDLSIMHISESRRGLVSVSVDGSGRNDNIHANPTGRENVRKCKGVRGHLSIPYVLHHEEVLNLELKIIGYGHIDTKIHEDCEDSNKFSKIWCAWLGDGSSDDCHDLLASPKCNFAIVNMPYTFDLGKKCAIVDGNRSPSPDSFFQINESGIRTKKRKKSFSDSEDNTETFIDKCGSCCEHSQNVDCCSPHSQPFQRMHSRSFMHKLRKQKPSIVERNCDICRQPLLLGKDVATLLNLKTGRFACSSRNINGAFHLFHVSCLINWVLFFEFELWIKQTIDARCTRGRKKKVTTENNHFPSIFCPECQGTGTIIEGDALEKPTVPLSETFLYKLRVINAQKAWMKSPENLQKCSLGLCFPSDTTMKLQQGKVMPSKLLLFYRADE